jgi:hypothetical protein
MSELMDNHPADPSWRVQAGHGARGVRTRASRFYGALQAREQLSLAGRLDGPVAAQG